MTTPRRRPIPLDDNWAYDLHRLERVLLRDRDEILAGLSALKQDLYDAGWPDHSPPERTTKHYVKRCDNCGEKFTSNDAANYHRDETGHSQYSDPNKSKATTVWQCCTCSNQFSTWDLFELHAKHSGHPEATEETCGHDATGKDHNDPAGEAAMHLWDKHGDLQSAQDHWHAITTSLRALKLISARHLPAGDKHTEPACSHPGCENSVEKRYLSNGQISYRGMQSINGAWYVRPGEQPTCSTHRKANDRLLARS